MCVSPLERTAAVVSSNSSRQQNTKLPPLSSKDLNCQTFLSTEKQHSKFSSFCRLTQNRLFIYIFFPQNLKKTVDERQVKLFQAKGEYKTALKNLEMISDEIHERRRTSAMGPRGRGVGAEGSSISGDDISNFKMDSDGVSSEYKNSLPVLHFIS